MTTSIPEGTRCQCKDHRGPASDDSECPGEHGWSDEGQCHEDAVRMVTVTEYKRVIIRSWGDHEEQQERAMRDVTEHIPMCEACADYHEKKAGKP